MPPRTRSELLSPTPHFDNHAKVARFARRVALRKTINYPWVHNLMSSEAITPAPFKLVTSLVVLWLSLLGLPPSSFGQLREARTLFQWREAEAPDSSDDSLNSDRPSFTPNSTTLGKGVFQIESGYLFSRDKLRGQAPVASHQLPETQLRWGLFADWLEFRISQAFLSQEEMGNTLTGASDTQLGVSLALTNQQGILPESALIPVISVPSGSTWATDGIVRSGAALSYSWGFCQHWTLGASTQMFSEVDDQSSESFLATYQSCYLKRALGEKASTYSEWYASFPHQATSALPVHFFNTGILFLVSENLQWDARIGTNLHDSDESVFAGTGFSVRFR